MTAADARPSLPVELAKIALAGTAAGAAVHAAAHIFLRSEISFWDVAIAAGGGALAALAAILVVRKVYIGCDDWDAL